MKKLKLIMALTLVFAALFTGCSANAAGDDGAITKDAPDAGDDGAITKNAPDAVGDIVLANGRAIAAENAEKMNAAQKSAAVAVIFYVGTSEEDVLGAKMLGVGVKIATNNDALAWAIVNAEGYEHNITALQCTPSDTGSIGAADTATFTGEIDGSTSWAKLCAAVNDENTSGNYSAWEWVNAYAANNGLTGSYASGWYMPSIAELTMLYRIQDTVNASLKASGNTDFYGFSVWSSSQCVTYNTAAWCLAMDRGTYHAYRKNLADKCGVCCIRAF